MATLDATLYGSITDIAQRADPDGKINVAAMVNLMSQMNEMYNLMLWRPTNDKVAHETTRVVALPTLYRRNLNQGVASSKGATSKVTDRCTHIEGRSKVDAEVENVEGENFAAYRSSEDMMWLEAFMQRFEHDMFYATTTTDPEDMSGFAQRYNALSGGQFSANVISGGGSGSDLMSIYLITTGPQASHCIYPKNSTAGFHSEDKGKITTQDASQREYDAFVTLMTMRYGLAVRDPRTCARGCNIRASTLTRDASAGTDLLLMFEQLIEVTDVAGAAGGKKFFITTKKIRDFMASQARNHGSVELSFQEVARGGELGEMKRRPTFGNIPIVRSDALLETESTIS